MPPAAADAVAGTPMKSAPSSGKILRAAAREPLLHFVVAGGLLFAVHARVAKPPAGRIAIEKAYVDALRAEEKQRTGQAPTDEQTRNLVERTVDDEVLYREALALGLDKGDLIVRRRLLQKMELIARASVPEPTDEELGAYLRAHADRYKAPETVSFRHVFLSRDRHGDALAKDAEQALSALRGGADPAKMGDPFLLGASFAKRSRADLTGTFGPGFAEGLFAAKTGEWSGPVSSSYGLHLVMATAREDGGAPDLSAVRARVREDLTQERRDSALRDEIARLRGKYTIEIEP
ncbi:MAG: peptidyl-prolyl cis-trans isomerase [Polyangiaceae bacterium]